MAKDDIFLYLFAKRCVCYVNINQIKNCLAVFFLVLKLGEAIERNHPVHLFVVSASVHVSWEDHSAVASRRCYAFGFGELHLGPELFLLNCNRETVSIACENGILSEFRWLYRVHSLSWCTNQPVCAGIWGKPKAGNLTCCSRIRINLDLIWHLLD